MTMGIDPEYETSPAAASAAARWWQPAREREFLDLIDRSAREGMPDSQYELAMEHIMSPRWVPFRGPRKMPSLWVIASYWAERGDWFDVNLSWPQCFACGLDGGHGKRELDLEARWLSAKRLQRGHIVNWARHGLDQVHNLVPLCEYCNKQMPIFGVENGEDAVAWIAAGGAAGEIEARLMAKGMSWRQAGLAYLAILDKHGGPALADEKRAALERFYRRRPGTRKARPPARRQTAGQLSFDDLMA